MEWLNLATIVFLRFVVVVLKLSPDLFRCAQSCRCVDILIHLFDMGQTMMWYM